eukprot:TRINITY_DN3424_c0_g1_i1.p1 TRINITY_DN3424_c0_g1~~TRINITY_DN3424_c0_g1_i1.p1  ORF type:complete len:171 (+),score=16.46 TRINITY_DN3424_c0_g1_i1:87-599(+)
MEDGKRATSGDSDDEHAPEYKVSKAVTVEHLATLDSNDESLRKYKESLLGQAMTEKFAPADDPRRVVITEFRIICEGRPGGDIAYPLADKAAVDAMKETPFVLKEGCNYKFAVLFRVQHEIVSGLKYVMTVTRKGIPGSRTVDSPCDLLADLLDRSCQGFADDRQLCPAA